MEATYRDGKQRIRKFERREIDGEEYLVETRAWKNRKREQRLQTLLENAEIPGHVRNLAIDEDSFVVGGDEDRKILRNISSFYRHFDTDFRNCHLYVWSPRNGTQKTTLVSTLGKELLAAGYNVRFVLMSSLTRLLAKEDFAESREQINSYRRADFLIIDDAFDTRKMTVYKSGYQIPYLDNFLRERLEVHARATAFTSNIPPENISEEVFGKSMRELIRRTTHPSVEFSTPYSARNNFDPDSLWER